MFAPGHPKIFDPKYANLMLTQTGSACRAPNYLSCLRRALRDLGYPQIPVIPLTTVEKFDAHHPGLEMTVGLYREAAFVFIMGDLLQRLLLRTRPYELEPNSANKLCVQMMEEGISFLEKETANFANYKKWVKRAITLFEELPLRNIPRKPRVGIVGEIGVQLRPSLNNYLIDQLEMKGAEAVCLGMIDFVGYCIMDEISMNKLLRHAPAKALVSKFANWYVNSLLEPIREELSKSKRFDQFSNAEELIEMVRPHCSPLMLWGEGWLLVAEMVEMITVMNCPNILVLQPWGCLPNHITGRGFIKHLRETFPGTNIVPIDFDTSASEVNQVNRITLMLSVAKDALKRKRLPIAPAPRTEPELEAESSQSEGSISSTSTSGVSTSGASTSASPSPSPSPETLTINIEPPSSMLTEEQRQAAAASVSSSDSCSTGTCFPPASTAVDEPVPAAAAPAEPEVPPSHDEPAAAEAG